MTAMKSQPRAKRGEAAAERWRVHAVEPRSRANGPGTRFVIWSQGCTLVCLDCFNPRTHPPELPPPAGSAGVALGSADYQYATEQPPRRLAAAAAALAGQIEGVTLTGGEPLQQPAAIAAFCSEIRAGTDLGIILLSGFTRGEIEADPARLAAVADVDMVIAGRYNRSQHLGSGLRGSANKEYWARTGRYRAEDFDDVPDLEIAVSADGTITFSGMPDGPVAFGRPPGQPSARRLQP
jgi:anaerobic ribonucleoside-triphosphate reductase activating protein